MKKLFIGAILLISSFAVKAQEIQLEEVKVLSAPQITKVGSDHNGTTFNVEVQEASEGDFHRDPTGFLKQNLDMSDVVRMSPENTRLYSVTFRSTKGTLTANFDKNGALKSTSQKFRNIILPADLRAELYRDYQGWAMVGNKYVAKGDANSVEKRAYHIKLKKGKRTKNIVLKKGEKDAALAMK